LRGQELLDTTKLVEIDVNDLAAVLQIVAGIMAVEPRSGREVAAAENIGGLIEVDIAMNIRRDAVAAAVRIVSDQQAHWDMRRSERLGELNSGITADRMPHNGNRLRVAAVIANRLISHTAPARV